MPIIAKTSTEGYRPCIFRNQPVHDFYGHLQAVLKDIRQNGELEHLFARPTINPGTPHQIEWSIELSGQAKSFAELSPEQQKATARKLSQHLQAIRKYSKSHQNMSGIEKDYADYLAAIAVSPDMNQVYVLGNQPVLIHWGFINENSKDMDLKAQDSWQQFIVEVQRQSKAEIFNDQKETPPIESIPAKDAAKPANTETKITESNDKKDEKDTISPSSDDDVAKEKPLVSCGMGKYVWIKLLAILLAIIILLLLLFRLFPDLTKEKPDNQNPTAMTQPAPQPSVPNTPSSPNTQNAPNSPGSPSSPNSPSSPDSPKVPNATDQPGITDSPTSDNADDSQSPARSTQPENNQPLPEQSEQNKDTEQPDKNQGQDKQSEQTEATPDKVSNENDSDIESPKNSESEQVEPFVCPYCGRRCLPVKREPNRVNNETSVQPAPVKPTQTDQH